MFTFCFSAYANNILKKPVQDQNSPLTVPAVETEQAPPKPKKFFKSRNVEPYPPVPQITYAPPVPAAPLSPEHPSNSKEKKASKRSRAYTRDSSSPEIPWRGSEKPKTKKSVATKASKKEEAPNTNIQPPNKRYLVRNRDKVINYAEDGSNSPIPDFSRYEPPPPSKIPPLKISSPKIPSPKIPSPKASPVISSPIPTKTDVVSPSTSKETSEDRKPPPIVLRISKGTSRIVSTDSNEGFTSPGSDRHSSMDTHYDMGPDQIKKSPAVESICSPKHEGLKITIKCSGLTDGKKDKKKEKKEHKSHKRHHHKNSDDEPLKKASSPLPGSDAYDLYKTLASPAYDFENESKPKAAGDDIESQLARLDSTGPLRSLRSPRLEALPNEPHPEPKPPETGGRSRRNRPNVNYSETDDYLDALTTTLANKHITKTVSDLRKEGRKGRKKQDPVLETPDVNSPLHEPVEKAESLEKNDLIDILSGGENSKETYKKPHKKQKHKHKHSSPDKDLAQDLSNSQSTPPESEVQPEPVQEMGQEDIQDEPQANEPQGMTPNTQSSDSAYNSCPNENFEEDSQRHSQEDIFKPPVMEAENHMDDKPSVKLVITKKKGSIFKSKSLVNDLQSPLPARKRRHLYRHEWANDVSYLISIPNHLGLYTMLHAFETGF